MAAIRGLSLSAYLVIEGGLSAGALVASLVLMGRAFVCFDAALVHLRGFVAAQASYARLRVAFARPA